MIEIIAAVWLVSFLLSVPITIWNIRSAFNAARLPQMKTLNANLEKIDLFWSLSQESIRPLGEMTPQEDLKEMIRSYLFMGSLGLLSIPGTLLLFAISFSMQKLIKHRATEKILNSELAKVTTLDSANVKVILDSL